MGKTCRCLFYHPDSEEEKVELRKQLKIYGPNEHMAVVLREQLKPCWSRKEEGREEEEDVDQGKGHSS